MKSPTEPNWEKTLSRYLAANGIPLAWNPVSKRYEGVAGHTFARLNPRLEEGAWARMPHRMSRIDAKEDNLVMFVTNKMYGDSVDDNFVVMRLGTFIPMMKALVESDRERWSNAPNR